jgi:hypothetical protein
MDNIKDVLAAQNKRILTLQLLVEALVDELIETKKVKEKKLDVRFLAKMKWANDELDKAKEEASIEFLSKGFYSNQMGEA